MKIKGGEEIGIYNELTIDDARETLGKIVFMAYQGIDLERPNGNINYIIKKWDEIRTKILWFSFDTLLDEKIETFNDEKIREKIVIEFLRVWKLNVASNTDWELYEAYEKRRTQKHSDFQIATIIRCTILQKVVEGIQKVAAKYQMDIQKLEKIAMGSSANEEEYKIDGQRKYDTTETLLIIHYLQQYGLFPKTDRKIGQTDKQVHQFIADTLGYSYDKTKKGMERVSDILKGEKSTTRENKSKRLAQLQKVREHFTILNHTDIISDIDTLTNKIAAK